MAETVKRELTLGELWTIEQNASKKCGAFGHPHVYHCSPAPSNPWNPPRTNKTLCFQIRAALIHFGWSQEEIAERYGKDEYWNGRGK